MYLENLVFDAVDPQRLGRFWQSVVDGEPLTDEPAEFETRLEIPGGPTLDLCFQRVATAPSDPVRLHLDLRGGTAQAAVVQRCLDLGAARLDIGQGDVPWVVLADPEGNPFCVMEDRSDYVDTGPIAALPLDSADPGRDLAFWSWLTGWVDVSVTGPKTLRHPGLRGPLLELCLEPKAADQQGGQHKNRLHLDVRLEPGEDPDEVAADIVARGGRELHHPEWGAQPWRFYADPSGNDFCVLPAATSADRLT